jgi:hypothetical protein
MNEVLMARKVVAMARGIVVLDENVSGMESELNNRNIKVIPIPKGTDDEIIKKHYLPGRIIITANSRHFVGDASSYEYGIIALDKIKFKDPKKMASIVSDAFIREELWSKAHGFIIELDDDGNGKAKNLTD